jgi:hypothetical protein
MKRVFSWLSGSKTKSQRSHSFAQYRPAGESLEKRQLMACDISLEFDAYYQVPVLALRGTDQRDLGWVGVEVGVEVRELQAKIICGDEVKEVRINLKGGFAPGYIFFDGFDGNDDFLNNTTIPSILQGGRGNDVLLGGSGPDQILGSWGGDILEGRAGDDIIYGGYGVPGEVDTAFGGSGNDHIEVHTLVSFVYGGPDNDYLLGGDGDDTLKGQGGRDTLVGQDGIDTLDGGADADDISPGNDVWADFVRGGPGADTFYHPASGLGAKFADTNVADRYVLGDVEHQAPPEAMWEAAVQASFRNPNHDNYVGENETSSSALTIGEGWSAQFEAGDHGITIIEPDWQNMIAPVDDYLQDINESLVESAEDDTSWADEDDHDAINDAALLALLAEENPPLEETDPAAEESDLLEADEGLEIDLLFAEEPELVENEILDCDLSFLESDPPAEEEPIDETTEELYVYETYTPSWSSQYVAHSWAKFRW